jgi:hypothetical protein
MSDGHVLDATQETGSEAFDIARKFGFLHALRELAEENA